MEIFYLPLIPENSYIQILSRFNEFRNKLYGIPPEIASQSIGEFFTIPRIHHYPKGGGFLAPHVDKVAPQVTFEIAESQYYQMSITMSKYGEDYFIV